MNQKEYISISFSKFRRTIVNLSSEIYFPSVKTFISDKIAKNNVFKDINQAKCFGTTLIITMLVQ